MTYRLVYTEHGVPTADFDIDQLFDADAHSDCKQGRSPLWFLCLRPQYLIERMDDQPLEAIAS